MSDYKKITKHPQNGGYELADWHDDYFGPHAYGVEFRSDSKIYPADLVERAQVYDFYIEDVMEAFEKTAFAAGDEEMLDFLNAIQEAYAARWKADPITGNGATEKSRVVKRRGD